MRAKLRKLLLASLWLISCVAAAPLLADTAQELYEKSVEANDYDLRTYYRTKLAKQYPNTEYGIFARAWLADQANDKDTSIPLYRQAIARGQVAAAFNNLTTFAEVSESEKAQLRSKALTAAIKTDDPSLPYYAYIKYYLNDYKPGSSEQRSRLLRQLANSDYDYERLAGVQIAAGEAKDQGDWQAVVDIIDESTQDGTSEDLITLYVDAVAKIGAQEKQDASTIINNLLAPAQQFLSLYPRNSPLLEQYFYSVWKESEKLTRNNKDLIQLFNFAYDTRESPGLIGDLMMVYMRVDPSMAKPKLDRAIARFPDYAIPYTHLADYYQYADYNPQKMLEADANAVRYELRDSNRAAWLKFAVLDALRNGMPNEAQAMLDKYQNLNESAANEARLLVAFYNQDFAKAQAILNKVGRDEISDDLEWIADAGYANFQDKTAAQKQNPFLTNWDSEFGGSLSLGIEFPVNSAVIPSSAYAQLDKAASALKRPGGEKYIFMIEGHTDPTGGNKINMPLSQKRAASVREYLIQRHGIDGARLQALGMGDVQPLATNLTEQGRKRNRRVDIRPYGNISEPQLVTGGLLDTDNATFSNDGRFVATGTNPTSLWDLRYGVRVRELFLGSNLRKFSPNNRYIAQQSTHTDGRGVKVKAVYVTDTKTGFFQAILPVDASDLSWSPDSEKLAYSLSDGTIGSYDIKRGKLLASRPQGSIRIAAKILWTKDGKYLVAGQARHEVVDILDASSLAKVKQLKAVNWPHSMGQSDDGRVVIISNNDRSLTLLNTQTWELIDRVKNPAPIPRNIMAIPGTRKFLFDDKFDGKAMAIFNYETGEMESPRQLKQSLNVGPSPDGDTIFAATDNTIIRVMQGSFQGVSGFDSTADKARSGIYWDKKNDYLLLQDDAGLNIWQVSQARLVHRVNEENTTHWVHDEKRPEFWWALADSKELLRFSIKDFTVKRFAGASFNSKFLTISGNYLVGAEKLEAGGKTAKIALFDLTSQRKLYEKSIGLVTAPLRYGGGVPYSGIQSMALSPERNLLALSTWWNNGYTETFDSKNIQLFDLRTWQSKGKDILSPWEISDLSFKGAKGDEILVYDSNSKFPINLKTGEVGDTKLKGWPTLDLDDGSKVNHDAFYLEYKGKKRVVKENIIDAVADKARNVVITHNKNNVLTFYSLDTLEPRFNVFFKKHGEWLATDTRGFFTSSLNGTDNTYWTLGDNFLPFDALKEKFENDRAVKESLAAIFTGQKPIQPQPIIDPDVIDAPFEVALTSSAQGSTQDENYKMTLKITKTDKRAQDPTVYYLVNGRKSRGFDSDPFADLDESINFVRTIPLGIGENKIEAIVQYKGVDVHKEVAVITRNEVRKATAGKGTLWYFGVGVSEYANNLQNLDYADRDALELEKAFKAQQGKLFSRVNTKVLVNDDANARDIKIQLYDFLSQAAPEDNIVIFIAGHGVQDNSQALYFMPHDGDMRKPYTGMSMDDFKTFLDQRPFNQKALFLMDICHAGAFDSTNAGRLSSEDVIKKLSNGTATTVFSSSTGAQQSLEDESFGGGHGAFTYAILQAIKGAADKQVGDEDGLVSLMEMILYTKREVAKITNKAQQPTVPVLSNFKDYPLSQSL